MVSNLYQLKVGDQALSWDGSTTVPGIPLPEKESGGDVALSCLPFFHIGGLTLSILGSLFMGTRIIVMAKFEIEAWCELVQRHGVTIVNVVPPILLALTKNPVVTRYDLRSIRM